MQPAREAPRHYRSSTKNSESIDEVKNAVVQSKHLHQHTHSQRSFVNGNLIDVNRASALKNLVVSSTENSTTGENVIRYTCSADPFSLGERLEDTIYLFEECIFSQIGINANMTTDVFIRIPDSPMVYSISPIDIPAIGTVCWQLPKGYEITFVFTATADIPGNSLLSRMAVYKRASISNSFQMSTGSPFIMVDDSKVNITETANGYMVEFINYQTNRSLTGTEVAITGASVLNNLTLTKTSTNLTYNDVPVTLNESLNLTISSHQYVLTVPENTRINGIINLVLNVPASFTRLTTFLTNWSGTLTTPSDPIGAVATTYSYLGISSPYISSADLFIDSTRTNTFIVGQPAIPVITNTHNAMTTAERHTIALGIGNSGLLFLRPGSTNLLTIGKVYDWTNEIYLPLEPVDLTDFNLIGEPRVLAYSVSGGDYVVFEQQCLANGSYNTDVGFARIPRASELLSVPITGDIDEEALGRVTVRIEDTKLIYTFNNFPLSQVSNTIVQELEVLSSGTIQYIYALNTTGNTSGIFTTSTAAPISPSDHRLVISIPYTSGVLTVTGVLEVIVAGGNSSITISPYITSSYKHRVLDRSKRFDNSINSGVHKPVWIVDGSVITPHHHGKSLTTNFRTNPKITKLRKLALPSV